MRKKIKLTEEKMEYRYSVNFILAVHARFLTLFEASELKSKSQFISVRIFGEEFRVIKTDSGVLESVIKLSTLHSQLMTIGINYNQVVRSLKRDFSEKKDLAFLYKLKEATLELLEMSKETVKLSKKSTKNGGKNNFW